MESDATTPFPALNPPARILMGPGPSDVPASVLQALAAPTIGHLDPVFLSVLDELREMLRRAMRTRNALTLPVSGTGSAGMEAAIVNLVEPGDRVLVGVNGVFGMRIADVAARHGAEVVKVEAPWGRPIEADALSAAAAGSKVDMICVVHAETSTGVLQDIPPIREVADRLNALLLVDAVTSLGGSPLETDLWGIDALYSGTQKCLSCPPGLAPVSFSERATARMNQRATKVQSWYLDMSMVGRYWAAERAYHHTAPINMLYGLHEALRLVLLEGLDARWQRHAVNGRALVAGLVELGLIPRVELANRLPQLTTVAIPEGVDDQRTRRTLLERYGLELGGGLGPLAGNTWRIGLMGESSSRRNVLTCLASLGAVLAEQGHRRRGDPIQAAELVWAEA